MATILFANFPWWVQEPIADQPGRALLRRGIRAGSRWPFTMPSAYHPDRFQFGSYLPTPFFLGSAAAYVQRAIDPYRGQTLGNHEVNGTVHIRDSIARGESYESFFNYLIALKPTHLVIETGAASWAHDLKMLKDIKRLFSDVLMPDIRIAVAGPTVRSASATTPPGTVDAWLVGEYEKNALAFVRGASGVLDFAMLTRDEMNELPFPMYDEDAALNYWDGCPKGQEAPHLQLLTSRGCVFKCLSGDTPINTVEGMIPIRDLVGREGLGVFTYDTQQKRAKVSTARNIMKTGEGQKLVRVNFDDGSHIDCTPDHRFLSFKWGNQYVGESESVCEAKDLKPGTHLRALKTGQSGSYLACAWTRYGRSMMHRMIAEWMIGRPLTEEEQVHHRDHNKTNNLPENLQVCASAKEHFAQHPEISQRMKDANPAKDGLTPEWKEKLAKANRGKKRSDESKERYRLAAIKREAAKSPEQKKKDAQRMHEGYQAARPWEKRERTEAGTFAVGELVNHRVVSVVELPGLHDTFCMEVPDTGWFYANNVLVKNCCFCAWPATMTGNDPDGTKPRTVRFHSGEWVEGFIRHRMAIAEAAGTPLKAAYLDDDTANLSDKHTLEICAVMKRIGLPWSAMCRADTSSPEVWRAMKDAGCFGVKLGFESGSQRVVDEIVNKRLDLVKAAETARWLRKEVGMTVHGTFTIGLPGETLAEQQETKDFIEFLYSTGALDTHQLSGTATIEGTPLDAIAHGAALKAFPGAIAGDSFVILADGVKKAEGL